MRTFLDPLQFAYQPQLGVDDAVIYLLQRAHMHLDGGGGTVRIAFFDFSSAFNTIQPLLMGEKLRVMGVDDTMTLFSLLLCVGGSSIRASDTNRLD